MDKIINSAFDFFAYALPGSCMFLGFWLLNPGIESPMDLAQIKTDSIQIGIFLVFGYLIGFSLNNIGRFLYKKLGRLIWPNYFRFQDLDTKLTISEKYALIRELSPLNFKYVETWNVFCGMSHNMALFCGMLFFITALKLTFFVVSAKLLWFAILVCSFLFFFLFVHRAVVFYSWAALDIIAAIKMLKLIEKTGTK